MRFWIVLAALAFVGCGAKKPPETVTVYQPVVVDRPVVVKATPPPELLAPIEVVLAAFVAPTHPEASSALTPEGEKSWRAVIEELLARIKGWEAWAKAP